MTPMSSPMDVKNDGMVSNVTRVLARIGQLKLQGAPELKKKIQVSFVISALSLLKG